jgi:hypothetical protein
MGLSTNSRRSYSPELLEVEDDSPSFSCIFPALRLGAEILLLLSKMYRAGIKGWVAVQLFQIVSKNNSSRIHYDYFPN